MPKEFYDPYDWYWLAEDGRLYASKRQIIVTESDTDFLAWQQPEPLQNPQQWPRDDAGAQTTASMQAVMDAYGLTVPEG